MTTARRLIDDCFLHDKDRLKHDDVLKLLRDRLSAVAGTETAELAQADGRVLAEDVVAPRDIPAHTNAAVDGYAFAFNSLQERAGRLKIAGRIQAGELAGRALEPGEAVRIFTGAALPEGADTCIMQEDAGLSDGYLDVPAGVKSGINVRAAGEDQRQGAVIAAAGQRLRPQDLAAIASSGAGQVMCYCPLKIALISTGDEIIRPGTAFQSGQVYDANHFMLNALLKAQGMEVEDLGILPDDKAHVHRAITAAVNEFDVIITSGGASRGDADYIVETITELGSLQAWQLAVKPGRPLALGQIRDTVFLGLPGNPVASFVCFLFYAQPMLALLQGAAWQPPQRFLVPSGFSVAKKKTDRREFLRGWVDNSDGGPVLQKFGRDGSGLISGLQAAGGFIEICEEVSSVAKGDPLSFIPFSEFGLPPGHG